MEAFSLFSTLIPLYIGTLNAEGSRSKEEKKETHSALGIYHTVERHP